MLKLERRPHTTREFLYKLGEYLWTETGNHGILTAAYKAKVPIFCPAIADSSIGMGLSQARHRDQTAGYVDVIGDIIESANIVIRRPSTATIVLGGGTPKNFINQASVQAEFYDDRVGGHKFAIQIVTDVPHFGGASGSSLEEAQSWGKLSIESEKVTVQGDVTIALPLLVTALESDRPRGRRQAQAARVRSVRPAARDERPARLPDNRYSRSPDAARGPSTTTLSHFSSAVCCRMPRSFDESRGDHSARCRSSGRRRTATARATVRASCCSLPRRSSSGTKRSAPTCTDTRHVHAARSGSHVGGHDGRAMDGDRRHRHRPALDARSS